jgi:hypothetical protein
MSNIKTTVTAALLGVIAAISSGATSAGATITKVDIPPGMAAPFPRCPDHEPLIIQSGYVQLLWNERSDKSGGLHITWRQQLIDLVAIGGSTGAEYRMVGNVSYFPPLNFTTVNDTDPVGVGSAQTVLHQTLSIQAVPTGGIDDAERISIHVLTQITINANGEHTAELANVSATCDG